MSNTELVTTFLRKNKRKFYCDDCLSTLTKVKPRNQVNQITKPLGEAADFERRDEVCINCECQKRCTAFVG